LTAKDIVPLIEDVLHNPEFNADDVNSTGYRYIIVYDVMYDMDLFNGRPKARC
jgi:hypothetical protein